MLFEEFFMQGDIELAKEIPISMLCDRSKTNVAGAQPGFINFVVLPIFNPISAILPKMTECLDALKANVSDWKSYVETDEDKQVYVKPKVSKLDSVIEHDCDDNSCFGSDKDPTDQRKRV